MAKALFLDRDGTIIVDKNYLADPAGVELIPGAAAALQRATELGYLLFLLTNQSGIGRGLHSLDDARRVTDRMEELLGLPRPLFAGICVAPEAPDQPSLYRKPSPRYLHEMIAAHSLVPEESWMIGDRESDIETGRNAGVRTAGVCTGKLDRAGWETHAYPGLAVFSDLAEFAATLI
jgi:D-glycero-D-manno-heptose 1,7-bisphosphate phosphatase